MLYNKYLFQFGVRFDHLIDTQNCSDTPCLRDRTTRIVRRISVINFVDRRDSAYADVFFEVLQDLGGFVDKILAVEVEIGLDVVFQ